MKTFDDFSEAFDYCREADKPVTVIVLDERYEHGEYKLYPSGIAQQLCSYAGEEA